MLVDAKLAPGVVAPVGVEAVHGGHLRLGQRKAEHVKVRFDSSGSSRLGDHYYAALHLPANAHLRGADGVGVGNRPNYLVLQRRAGVLLLGGAGAGERGVGGEGDALGATPGQELLLAEEGMRLDLVHRGHRAAVVDQILDLRRVEV